MISFIRGRVAGKDGVSVIIDTGSIGYEVFMTSGDLERIGKGEELKLHTFFHVREDAMQLYGFLSADDLRMFRLLLGVNGIGPKAAMGILSGITSDELRFAVLSDDVKTISGAPGIGKKTAQKLILELRDKLNLKDAFDQKFSGVQKAEAAVADGTPGAGQEAVEALVALGYSSTDALRAVRQAEDVAENDVEAILKAALRFI